MGGALQKNPEAALAGAAPYLSLFGLAAGGIYLAKGALAAARNGSGAAQASRSPSPASLPRTSPPRPLAFKGHRSHRRDSTLASHQRRYRTRRLPSP